MTRSKRSLVSSAVVVAAALVVHFLLIRWLAERNVVETIFAGGSHVPRGTAALALAFMVVRLFTALLLPGVVLSALGAWAVERWAEKRDAAKGPPGDAGTSPNS
ncbi:MAG: hypothetical protein AAB215_04190 [Planctomycetota bacterium]